MRRLTLIACGTAIAALVLSGCGKKSDDTQNNSQNNGQNNAGSGLSSLKLLTEEVSRKSAQESSAHMKFTADAAGMSYTGSGDLKLGTDPAMRLTMAFPGMGDMEMRLVGDAFYVKLPQARQGKPWVKIDSASDDPVSKSLGAVIKQLKDNGDPSQLLKQLEDAGEITATKQEDLNGKPTTHYSVTVDVKKLAGRTDLSDILAQANNAGIDNFPVEVWLDQENLPVRVIVEMRIKQPRPTHVKLSVDYTDWGTPVTVTAPPADEVGELPRR